MAQFVKANTQESYNFSTDIKPPQLVAGQNSRRGLGATFPAKKAKGPSNPADRRNTPKMPFQALVESYPIVAQMMSFEEGKTPTKQNWYRCMVELKGTLFSGEGQSKKIAKHVMAERALAALLPNQALAETFSDKVAPFAGPDKPGEAVKAEVKMEDDEAPSNKKTKKMKQQSGPKPALQLLFEKCSHEGLMCEYVIELGDNVTDDTPVHKRTYKCTAKIGTKEVSAESNSKKIAKREAAANMLKTHFGVSADQIQIPASEDPSQICTPGMDFQKAFRKCCMVTERVHSAVNVELTAGGGDEPEVWTATTKVGQDEYQVQDSTRLEARLKLFEKVLKERFNVDTSMLERMEINLDKYTKTAAETRSPNTILSEFANVKNQKVEYNEPELLESEEKSKHSIYTCTVVIKDADGNENVYTSQGPSKKLARAMAAREALAKLYGLDTPDPTQVLGKRGMGENGEGGGKHRRMEGFGDPYASRKAQMDFMRSGWTQADHVANTVRTKYLQLCTVAGVPPCSHLAGFVLTTGTTANDYTVVALGSGDSCRDTKPDDTGLTLFDLHAEVLARRGLLLFFYQQLSMMNDPYMASLSIFERHITAGGSGYKLKDNHHIHLYTTWAPRGDARVLGEFEKTDGGLLRYYSAINHSSQPVGTLPQQTWADIRSGKEQMRIMSVSDKVLKWNAIGLQGALLSHFVEPVRLSSLVVGTAVANQRDTLMRAVYGRAVPKMDANVTAPDIPTLTQPEAIQGKPRPPVQVILWSAASPNTELVDMMTGRDMTGKPSRVCKQLLFEEWHKVAPRLQPKDKTFKAGTYAKYGDAKMSNAQYLKAKQLLYETCRANQLGNWQVKPKELDQFGLPWADI